MVFKEGLDEVVRVSHVDVISALIRRTLFHLGCTKKEVTCAYSVKAAVCKQGGEPSPRIDSAGTLILHLPACTTARNKYLLFRPPVCGIFLSQPELRQGEREALD